MIDAPGPWGSGPFTLVAGYSSLENEVAPIAADPFACVWLPTDQPRSERVVLEANTDHWNRERGPRLERVIFRNDLSQDRAIEFVCTTEGDVDIVTEVDPSDAQRVIDSEYARLEAVDAMRSLAQRYGLFVGPSSGANLIAAKKVRAAYPEFKTVVTLLCDEGEKYIQEYFAETDMVRVDSEAFA